jgi:predicted metal-dependent hydrolase
LKETASYKDLLLQKASPMAGLFDIITANAYGQVLMMDFTVLISGRPMRVEVTRKAMKTARLRVLPSAEIKLSVPRNTPNEWIEEFLSKKQKWMEEKVLLFGQSKAAEKETHVKSGASTQILGRPLMIKVEQANQKRVLKNDSTLFLYTTNAHDQDDIDRQFNNWWQRTSKEYFTNEVNRLYSIIEKYGIGRPKVAVKKMKTRWGSCSRRYHKINLNFYLYKAPLPCIEYVILHELANFLYPHHKKDFYDFISVHMPDWREREQQLNSR